MSLRGPVCYGILPLTVPSTVFAAFMLLCMMMTVQVQAADPGEEVGRIKTLKGESYIIRGSEGRRLAMVNDRVYAQDQLETGADGSMGVTFIDNSRFSVGPNSLVSLDRFDFNPTTHAGVFESRINRGTLAVTSGKIAKQSASAMKVKTRATVLGVRGTNFLVKVDP